MFAMTISQLFNDDVLKRASIVSICQFASLSLVSLKETPLHINTKVNVFFRILIRLDFLKINFFSNIAMDQTQTNVGFPPKLLWELSQITFALRGRYRWSEKCIVYLHKKCKLGTYVVKKIPKKYKRNL